MGIDKSVLHVIQSYHKIGCATLLTSNDFLWMTARQRMVDFDGSGRLPSLYHYRLSIVKTVDLCIRAEPGKYVVIILRRKESLIPERSA